MTEFTIVGNLVEVIPEYNQILIEEGKHTYTINVSKSSTLIEDLLDMPIFVRIKVNGIITKDTEDNEVFICNKANVMLGGKE